MNIIAAILSMWAQGCSIPTIAAALEIDNNAVNLALWQHFADKEWDG